MTVIVASFSIIVAAIFIEPTTMSRCGARKPAREKDRHKRKYRRHANIFHVIPLFFRYIHRHVEAGTRWIEQSHR